LQKEIGPAEGTQKMGRGIAIFLFVALLATYVFVVMVPAFAQAGGIPADLVSLAWPPALMVIGFGCLQVFGALAKKKAAEGKKE
jgi:hypothetical protein